MNKVDSAIITWLRFPLTFAVVAQHCMGTALIDWNSLGTKDIPGLVKTLISGCAVQVAVPAFFFISGFLFFQGVTRMDWKCYQQKMSRRLISLVTPYLLWNLLSVPLLLLVMYGETHTGTSTMADLHDFWEGLSVKGIFWSYSSSPYAYPNIFGGPLLYASPVLGPFWFVRDLIIVSVLSPLVWWFVKKTKVIGVCVLLLIYLFRIWPYTAVNSQILFFVFGAYWSIYGRTFTLSSKYLRHLLYGVTVFLLAVLVRLEGNATYWGFQLMPLFTVIGTTAVVCLAGKIVQTFHIGNTTKWLSKSSFFVYALHMNFALPLGFFFTKALFKHIPVGFHLHYNILSPPV